jgi:hypothetical protein
MRAMRGCVGPISASHDVLRTSHARAAPLRPAPLRCRRAGPAAARAESSGGLGGFFKKDNSKQVGCSRAYRPAGCLHDLALRLDLAARPAPSPRAAAANPFLLGLFGSVRRMRPGARCRTRSPARRTRLPLKSSGGKRRSGNAAARAAAARAAAVAAAAAAARAASAPLTLGPGAAAPSGGCWPPPARWRPPFSSWAPSACFTCGSP